MVSMPSSARRVALLLSALGLGACGGGGSSVEEKRLSFSLSQSSAACSADLGTACAGTELFATAKHTAAPDTPIHWYELPDDGKSKTVVDLNRQLQSDGRWALRLGFSNSLAPGVYTGAVEVTLATLGSSDDYIPAKLSYRLEVRPAGGTQPPLQAIAGAADWLDMGGTTARNGLVPVALNAANFSRRWTRLLEVADTKSAGLPVLASGQVLLPGWRPVGERGNAWTLKEQDGSPGWSATLAGRVNRVLPDGAQQLWLSDTTGADSASRLSINALAVGDGAVRWQQERVGAEMPGGVSLAQGLLLLPNGKALQAVSSQDAQARWSSSVSESGSLFDYTSWAATVDARLAYSNVGGTLRAHRLSDGGQEFSLALPSQGRKLTSLGLNQAPVLVDASTLLLFSGRLSVAGDARDSHLSAVDLVSRSLRWTVDGQFVGLPVAAEGVLYVSNQAGRQVEARKQSDGSLLWSWPMEASDLFWQQQMVLTKTHLFVSTDKQTLAIDLATRQAVWRYPLGGWLGLSSQGVLYVMQRAGAQAALAAFNLR